MKERKKSHNRPLKNKTIPEKVYRGTNNFHKSFVASTKNMSKCLKKFKFIMTPSSDIRRLEHSYRWKYGTNIFKSFIFDIIFFQKNLRNNVGYPTLEHRKTYGSSVGYATSEVSKNWHQCVEYLTHWCVEKPMPQVSKIRWRYENFLIVVLLNDYFLTHMP